jgi:hypothetical protein
MRTASAGRACQGLRETCVVAMSFFATFDVLTQSREGASPSWHIPYTAWCWRNPRNSKWPISKTGSATSTAKASVISSGRPTSLQRSSSRLRMLTSLPTTLKSRRLPGPSGRRTLGVDKLEAAKLAIHVEFVCDFQSFPTPSWRSDGSCFTCELLRLFCKLAVEFRQCPKEPVRIPHDYFRKGFSLIFAKWHYAPMHIQLPPS